VPTSLAWPVVDVQMKYVLDIAAAREPGVDSSGLSVWCVVVHASDSEVAVDPTLTMALYYQVNSQIVAIEAAT